VVVSTTLRSTRLAKKAAPQDTGVRHGAKLDHVEVGSHLHIGVRHGAKLEHYAKIFAEGLTEEQPV
jgi:hypothetical protein